MPRRTEWLARAKVAIAPSRGRYLRSHWLDAALVALPMLRPLRVAPSARMLRLLRLTHVSVALARSVTGGRRVLYRHGLNYVLLSALGVILLGGSLATLAEHHQPDATIQDLADGPWWAITTVTTVGYGDTYPRSAVGRGVGVGLMVLGISLFSVITANVAALFVEQREDELLAEVKMLRRELRDAFGAQGSDERSDQ